MHVQNTNQAKHLFPMQWKYYRKIEGISKDFKLDSIPLHGILHSIGNESHSAVRFYEMRQRRQHLKLIIRSYMSIQL